MDSEDVVYLYIGISKNSPSNNTMRYGLNTTIEVTVNIDYNVTVKIETLLCGPHEDDGDKDFLRLF